MFTPYQQTGGSFYTSKILPLCCPPSVLWSSLFPPFAFSLSLSLTLTPVLVECQVLWGPPPSSLSLPCSATPLIPALNKALKRSLVPSISLCVSLSTCVSFPFSVNLCMCVSVCVCVCHTQTHTHTHTHSQIDAYKRMKSFVMQMQVRALGVFHQVMADGTFRKNPSAAPIIHFCAKVTRNLFKRLMPLPPPRAPTPEMFPGMCYSSQCLLVNSLVCHLSWHLCACACALCHSRTHTHTHTERERERERDIGRGRDSTSSLFIACAPTMHAA
jgi:hypothetical protein